MFCDFFSLHKEVPTIFVTGVPGSGTSLSAAILERCGFNLGSSHPLFRKPGPDRPQGDLDNLGAVRINDKLLSGSGGTWNQVPPEDKMARPDSGATRPVKEFLLRFNGNIVKDPRLCLTIPIWQALCPQLEYVAFCLRNPLSVLLYLERRHFIPKEQGMMIWCEYAVRFARSVKVQVVVVDYDQIFADPESMGNSLPIAKAELSLLRKECNHFPYDRAGNEALPEPVCKLYGLLKSGTLFRKT